MAFVLADRVKETATSPGTGTATLLGAVSQYQSFSAGIGANNTTYYVIADQGGANWEVGLGTIGAGGTTLARTTIYASSNSGSTVNFSTGTQDIWCDYSATKYVSKDSIYAPSTFQGTFADGIVVDYTSTNGRISVGSADSITFYNGGVATTQLAKITTGGNLETSGALHVNSLTVGTSYTIPSGSSAVSAGPITINSGITVTVSSGSKWVVL